MLANEKKGYIFVIMTALLWGAGGVLGRYTLAQGVDPLHFSTLRAIICAVAFFVTLLITNKGLPLPKKKDLPFFAAYGLIGVSIFNVLFFYAIKLTSVAVAFVLLYTAPIFVVILSFLFLGERLTKVKGLALFLTFVGCILVVKAYDLENFSLSLLGVVTGLGAGLAYGLYTIFGKWATKEYRPWATAFYAFGFGALFIGLYQLAVGFDMSHYSLKAWFLILVMSIVCTYLPYGLFTMALSLLEASRVSIVVTMVPVVATATAWIFLGETVELIQLLGGISVVCGIMLVAAYGGKKTEDRYTLATENEV
jgi:drug/metabolite transporter (DMT)-like permease